MNVKDKVAGHYSSGSILERIHTALTAAGIDPQKATPEDLKPVDEFHIGGAAATRSLLEHVQPAADMEMLDVGCGIGGAARLIASEFGSKVHGVDLTPEFVETARSLSAMVGLSEKTSFEIGDAETLPVADQCFDGAIMLHVGMNVPDKTSLFKEVARTLRPGGWFALYDVMITGDPQLTFPVPWAAAEDGSFAETPADYRRHAERAGFAITVERDRREIAIDFFNKLQARAAADGPPKVGLHLLMQDAPEKFSNMIAMLRSGQISPVELVLQKPD